MLRQCKIERISLLFVLLVVLLPVYFLPSRVMASPAIGSETITIYSMADAHVNSSSPSSNYGGLNDMFVGANSEEDFAYVMFDLSSIPSNANIISAKLKLYLLSTAGEIYWYPADRIGAYYCSDNSWTELEITWNNKPSFNPEPTDSWSFTILYSVKVYKSWNVTQDVKTALPSGNLTEVLKFKTKTGDGHAVFQSREVANKPKLEVEYATGPVFAVHLVSVQDSGATANLGLMTFANYTFSLPTEIDVVNGSYAVTYSGGYMFIRWETTGGVTVSDENAMSTMVTVLGNGTLRVVGNVKKLEHTYDHGTPQWHSERTGDMDAVRFTPLFSGRLLTVRYYIYGLSSYQSNTFKVHVMDEGRYDIITPLNATPTSKGWFDVELPSPGIDMNEGVDFYLGMEWAVGYNPLIGEDTTKPSGRSWHWNGTLWEQETYSDFMIRAVVTTEPFIPAFHVPILHNAVTLDGVITGEEWADANRMNVTFETDGLTYNGAIGLKHDCTYLWMCIQIQDDDVEPYPSNGSAYSSADFVGIIFDANGDSTTDVGDDAAILIHDGIAVDQAVTAGPPPVLTDDNVVGGVFNVEGASEWAAGVYTFEARKPLNSGDSGGYDIALSPGDEIRTMFLYNDPGETITAPPFVGFILSLEPYVKAVFTVQDGYALNVTITSNSTISNFNFAESLKQISFNVAGPTGKAGYCNVTIPKDLLQGDPWTVYINSTDCTTLCSIIANSTHAFVYIPYNCSSNMVQIRGTWVIPEFPSSIIVPLFMMATLIAVITSRRKRLT